MNIAIAGAGIMGRVLAWRLINDGHSLSLFDQDAIDGGSAAAYTAAGILAPYSEVESAELLVHRMGLLSLQLWPEIIRQLQADVGYCQCGSLIVAHAQDRADHLRFNQQLACKLPAGDGQFQRLDRGGLQALEPELSERFSEATWLPQEAKLCGKSVMKALASGLLDRGAVWHSQHQVTALGERYLIANGQRYEFDWVIDCRGLGAKTDIPELRAVRGELIWLEAPDVNITRLVRLVHPRYRLYMVPQGRGNRYIVGATQIESDDVGPISVRSALELLSAAYSLHPGFAEAHIIETKTNCRPALKDNLPRIKYKDGLIHVNGLFRHGFLLAPSLALEVSRWLSRDAGSTGGEYRSQFPGVMQQAA